MKNELLLLVGCMLTCLSNGVYADEPATMRAEITDLKAKVAAMETKNAPAAGGDISSLTTMNKKGTMSIGGDVNMDVIWNHRDDQSSDSDTVDSTEFHTNSANLRFKISAARDTFLYIKLDLDDMWNETTEQDDLLEECKFVWNHVRGSNVGFVFGKGEVPYGQDKTLGIIQSYHHNDETYSTDGPIILLAAHEENTDAQDSNSGNPHADVGRTFHPGEVDNVYMFGMNYVYKSLLKFEMAVFQNNDTTGSGRNTRGMHEDRSDDNLFFNSFAARLWLMPTEGLQMELSFIREFTDSFGDKDLFGNNAEEDQYAVSFGFDYKMQNLPLEFFGEYQHGWDWNYTDNCDTNTYQLGMIWNATPEYNFGIMGEWLDINDDAADEDEDYARVVLSGEYKFQNGITLTLEYAHEWWDADLAAGDEDRDADVIAFRSGWAF